MKQSSLIKKALLAVAVAGIQLSAWAQTNVSLIGRSANAAGKQIGLYAYEDMLTLHEVLLDSTTVDSAGHFSLSCYVNYPRLVFLQVESYSQSFYIEAGRTYHVAIPSFDWTIDEQRNVYLDPEPLPLYFDSLPASELNLRIGRFDAVLDSLLSARRAEVDIRFRPSRHAFEAIVREADRLVPEADSGSFFARYKEYTMANMRLAMNAANRRRLAQRYVDGQPVRYHDENYMRFFFALYDHAISRGMARVPQHRLMAWVESHDLSTYLDSIGLEPMLKNERVRELAVLQALKESYYDREYNRENVRQMVHQLGQRSKFEEHRRLAALLEAGFGRTEKGAEPPSMVLPDVDHHPVSLDGFRGKWVYISFVRVGDPNSQAEIETMAYFYDTLAASHPDVALVSISCDREFQKMYHFLKNNKRGARYRWTWLHFDGNYRLLESLGVVSYPSFLLLDPEGRQHYSVTPPPASGIFLRGPWQQAEQEEESILPFIQH